MHRGADVLHVHDSLEQSSSQLAFTCSKLTKKNTRARGERCSKLTNNTFVNFEQVNDGWICIHL